MTDHELHLAKRAAARLMTAEPVAVEEPAPQARTLPPGVYVNDSALRPFRVTFHRGGKSVRIGTFETLEQADRAAKDFRNKETL